MQLITAPMYTQITACAVGQPCEVIRCSTEVLPTPHMTKSHAFGCQALPLLPTSPCMNLNLNLNLNLQRMQRAHARPCELRRALSQRTLNQLTLSTASARSALSAAPRPCNPLFVCSYPCGMLLSHGRRGAHLQPHRSSRIILRQKGCLCLRIPGLRRAVSGASQAVAELEALVKARVGRLGLLISATPCLLARLFRHLLGPDDVVSCDCGVSAQVSCTWSLGLSGLEGPIPGVQGIGT